VNITLRVWRQSNAGAKGAMQTYQLQNVSPDMSFLEMLDLLNEKLTVEGVEPVAFDHDCREGICGTCGVVINGSAHGRGASPVPTTTCQLHMRSFADGATIDVEPWRAGGFPVIKDLVVDRTALDRIIQAGGFISTNTGAAPDANADFGAPSGRKRIWPPWASSTMSGTPRSWHTLAMRVSSRVRP